MVPPALLMISATTTAVSPLSFLALALCEALHVRNPLADYHIRTRFLNVFTGTDGTCGGAGAGCNTQSTFEAGQTGIACGADCELFSPL